MHNNSNENIVDSYAKQMAENHSIQIDKTFFMVVKQKPWWMPAFIYKSIIKNLVVFHSYKFVKSTEIKSYE